jgi:hypothetical protein
MEKEAKGVRAKGEAVSETCNNILSSGEVGEILDVQPACFY